MDEMDLQGRDIAVCRVSEGKRLNFYYRMGLRWILPLGDSGAVTGWAVSMPAPNPYASFSPSEASLAMSVPSVPASAGHGSTATVVLAAKASAASPPPMVSSSSVSRPSCPASVVSPSVVSSSRAMVPPRAPSSYVLMMYAYAIAARAAHKCTKSSYMAYESYKPKTEFLPSFLVVRTPGGILVQQERRVSGLL